MNKERLILLIGGIATIAIVIGAAFLFGGNTGQSSSANQNEGSADLNKLIDKPAPDFTLESYDGNKITLSSLKGKNVILFFNEGLRCYPACWDQIAAFGKDNEFKSKKIEVLAIVNDTKIEWKQAVDKMSELASTTVLLDVDKRVSSAYNMLYLPSSMHKGQLAGHTYVVIDKKGIVRYVKDDTQMAVRNQELLAEINKL